MKKISQSLLVAFIVIGFYSCNNNSYQKSKIIINDSVKSSKSNKYEWVENTLTKFCVKPGMGNFIIDSEKADTMIKHFNLIYGKYKDGSDIKALLRYYWIDKCTIFSIASFLRNSTKFDGIRITFGCSPVNDVNTYPKPPYQNRTTIFIYPTTVSNTGHKDSTDIMIPKLSSCSSVMPYVESFSTASSKISVFKTVYHNNAPPDSKTYSLSEGIWIDSCVIFYMEDLINQSGSLIDGIGVHTAAYIGDEVNLPKGADAKKASTIIFVPTNSNGSGGHSDNWGIISAVLFALQNKELGSGLNHGELCPNACN